MLPSKEESYELIEDCGRITKEVIDLLDVVIPFLVENQSKEELATLIRLSFCDIRAACDGIWAGCNYLKKHDEHPPVASVRTDRSETRGNGRIFIELKE